MKNVPRRCQSHRLAPVPPRQTLRLCSPHFWLSPCAGVEGLSLDMAFLVDIRDYVNKELALRIHTDIDSQGAFFTDLNGFQVTLGPHRTWAAFGLQCRCCGEVAKD